MTTPTPDSIIKAIQDKHVTMTPRWHFIARVVLMVLLIIFVAAFLFYLVSFLEYFWGRAHFDVLPRFGGPGFTVLALRFPWWHILVLLVGIVALIFLLRHFTAGYRIPFLPLVAGLVVVLLAASVGLLRTSIHQRLDNAAERHRLPIIGAFYRDFHSRLGQVHVGTIATVTAKGFTMVTDDDEATIAVTLNSTTHLSPGWTVTVGDHVAVLSDKDGSKITAKDVRVLLSLPPDQQFLPVNMLPPPGASPAPAY